MTATKLPTLFISHGGPNVVTDPSPAHDFLKNLSAYVPRPDAIVIASAHFEAPGPTVIRDPAPRMIYDFGGFAPELHEMVYPAPGHPELADTVADLLADAGFAPNRLDKGGYDHGMWNPLVLAFPQADIPVVGLSTDPYKDAAWHMSVGRALAPLRERNVLVIGSGHITHNLREIIPAMRGGHANPQLAGKVEAFTEWFHDALSTGDEAALRDWHEKAPFAADNHPTDEHLMPIFTAYGAAGEGATAERIHDSTQYGGMFAWDAYRFS